MDNFSKFVWKVPLKKKKVQTVKVFKNVQTKKKLQHRVDLANKNEKLTKLKVKMELKNILNINQILIMKHLGKILLKS